MRFTINVLDQRYQVYSTAVSGAIELGRQRQDEPGPYCQRSTTDGHRLILAALRETTISRQHLLIEPLGDESIRIKNTSARGRVSVEFHGPLKPGETCESKLPVSIKVARKRILHLEMTPSEAVSFEPLPFAPRPPLESQVVPSVLSAVVIDALDSDEIVKLVQGLETALSVMQASAEGSTNFISTTIQAIADVIGLDCAAYLRFLPDGHWETVALEAPMGSTPPKSWSPQEAVLDHVAKGLQTYRYIPRDEEERLETATWVAGFPAVVAAPVLDQQGKLSGAIYGERLQVNLIDPRHDITELEAALMQTVAGSLAAMFARTEDKEHTKSAAAEYADYFPFPVRSEIEKFADALDPQRSNITVAMVRLRNHGVIYRSLKPSRAARCLDNLLESIREVVEQQLGTVLDYAEGELTVMWGAPIARPDHAVLACRALPAIREVIERHSREWGERLSEPLKAVIAVHSETALVGPSGMPGRFRYGPLTDTLPRIRQVIDAAQMACAQTVLTGSTADLIESSSIRRLGGARLAGEDSVYQLYEIEDSRHDDWHQLTTAYESALGAFEKGEFANCIRAVAQVLQVTPNDAPSLRLQQLAGRAFSGHPANVGWLWNLNNGNGSVEWDG